MSNKDKSFTIQIEVFYDSKNRRIITHETQDRIECTIKEDLLHFRGFFQINQNILLT